MEMLNEWIKNISPPDENAAESARRRWDGLAKPLGSLGIFEDDLVRIAALTGSADIQLARRKLLVFCADNGVVAEGVSQCGSEVTAHVAAALAEGRSTISPMAKTVNCAVLPVDVGIRDFPGHPGVLDRRVKNGTENIAQKPAMTREACLVAMVAGARLVAELAGETDIFALGEMGIGNTPTACAVRAARLDTDPEPLVGRGAGLSDAGLRRKKEVIRGALTLHAPEANDPIDVLAKVGGLDIAAMCGAFLAAAKYRVPVVADGLISTVAALCAVRLCPAAKKALLLSHCSAEPAAAQALEALDLPAPITAGLRLGEGGGAVALLSLLDMALAVYNSGQTFDRLGIDAYTPQN